MDRLVRMPRLGNEAAGAKSRASRAHSIATSLLSLTVMYSNFGYGRRCTFPNVNFRTWIGQVLTWHLSVPISRVPCMLAPDLAIKGAQAINDAIAEMIQQHPDRFAGLASLPWQDVDATIDEMDRAHNLGFRGVILYSHIGGRPVDCPAFDPIYNHAQTKELPIVLHPTVPTWGEAIKDHSMIPMMGLQVDTSFALLRLILGGVLERHPRLKVVMPHVGGVLPYMMGRIEHQTEVMGRGREHIKQPPSTYMRGIYLDTVSPSAQALRYAYEFSGPEHLVFGTDHPWVDPQLFVTLVEEMDIPDSEKTQIFGGNAAELFGLSI